MTRSEGTGVELCKPSAASTRWAEAALEAGIGEPAFFTRRSLPGRRRLEGYGTALPLSVSLALSEFAFVSNTRSPVWAPMREGANVTLKVRRT